MGGSSWSDLYGWWDVKIQELPNCNYKHRFVSLKSKVAVSAPRCVHFCCNSKVVIGMYTLGDLALARGNADSFKDQSSKGFSVSRVVNNKSVVGKIYRYTGWGEGGGGAVRGNQYIPLLVQFRTGLCQWSVIWVISSLFVFPLQFEVAVWVKACQSTEVSIVCVLCCVVLCCVVLCCVVFFKLHDNLRLLRS